MQKEEVGQSTSRLSDVGGMYGREVEMGWWRMKVRRQQAVLRVQLGCTKWLAEPARKGARVGENKWVSLLAGIVSAIQGARSGEGLVWMAQEGRRRGQQERRGEARYWMGEREGRGGRSGGGR